MSDTRPTGVTTRFDLVVAVASYGGLGAVSAVLAGLPATFDVPLVLVQHRRADSDDALHARLLQQRTSLPVRVVCDGEPVLSAGVALVPAEADASLDDHGCFQLHKIGGVRPAVGGDCLFVSAARAAGAGLIGVVLTGKLHDGTEGVRAIKRAGGRLLVEDPTTALASSMPRSAIATGCVDHVLPARRIAAALVALVMAPGGAELFSVPTPAWARVSASSTA